MARRPAHETPRSSRPWFGARLGFCLGLLCTVVACGNQQGHRITRHYTPSRYYTPPGSSSDPWGPYVREASGRFGIPELWIRRVMRQESGGQEDVISWAGAMGLMQVMPDTYDGLRGRYRLGDDPFDPHNNILAGAAYLREMYDRFGAPGFLAAYNAGPDRLDLYLTTGAPLPDETVNYVAAIAPSLGPGTPLSGPLAVYAGTGYANTDYAKGRYATTGVYAPVKGYAPRLAANAPSSGCDPDAAYNPDGPCTPLRQPSRQPVVTAAVTVGLSGLSGGCDPDAAYNPDGPCTSPRPPTPQPAAAIASAPSEAPGFCDPDAAYNPNRPCHPAPVPPFFAPVVAEPLLPPPTRRGGTFASGVTPVATMPAQSIGADTGGWAIQVGAFASLASAEAAADTARMALPDVLRTARTELPPTTPFGGKPAYRARLAGLSPTAAATACAQLSGRGLPCMTVPPARGSF